MSKKTLGKRGGPDDGKIKAQAEEITNEMHKYKVQYRPGARIRQGAQGGDLNEIDFPVKISAPDDRDTLMEAKMQAAQNKAISPYGLVTASDDDWKWHMKKAEQVERLNLEKFIAQSFDLKNPADVDRLEKIDPDYFEQREAEIDQQAELQATLAKIRLRGIRSREDLVKVYGVMTERIPLPTGPLWDPSKWGFMGDETDSFNYGIFSPKRLFKRSTVTSKLWDPLDASNKGGFSGGVGLGGTAGINAGDNMYAAGNYRLAKSGPFQ